MNKYVGLLLALLLISCGGEPVEPKDPPAAVVSSSLNSSLSSSSLPVSSASSLSSSSSGTPVSQKTGQQYYQEFCANCHGDDGKLTDIADMNVLRHTEEELYSEILLTMPEGNPSACGQTCSIAVSDYIRDTLYATELASSQRVVGIKPTKLLPSDILAKVIKDTFVPIALDTSTIAAKLPAPLITEDTGFFSNADALLNGTVLEDLYDAVTPLAEVIAQSNVVGDMCSDDTGNNDAIKFVGNALNFSVPAGGDWHTIKIDMTADPDWKGNINHLRIDGPSLGGGSFRINHLRLLKNSGGFTEVVNWNNNAAEEGETTKHAEVTHTDSHVTLTLDPQNNDPFIVFDASYNVGVSDQVEIAIRNDSNNNKTLFQIFFSPVEPLPVSDIECATRFIERFAKKAFRRPLDATENNRFLELFNSGSSRANGLVRLAQGIMLSPDTLYQVEQEAASTSQAIPGAELAERLAMFLWGTIPDDALLAVADSLDDPAVMNEQAKRMLNSPKATGQLHKFVKEWLKINNPAPKPDFDLNVNAANAISDSLARFFDFMVREEEGTIFDLYMDRRAFITPEVATIYGVNIPSNTNTYQGGSQVLLPLERAGVITRAGFIAGLSGTELTNPTRVGNIIRERVLCQHIPLPSDPDDAVVGDAEGLVGREFVAVHNEDPACAGCHAYLDDIGLMFESFDPVGKYRTQYPDGEQIDPSGYYTSLSKSDVDQEGSIADSLEFSELLSQSDVAAECLAKNMMEYALDRPVQNDPGSFAAVMVHFAQSNYRLKELILAIVQSDAFNQQGAK